MNNLIKKAKTFKYNSFLYNLPSDPILIKEDYNTILIGEKSKNRIKCFFASNNSNELIQALNNTYNELRGKEIMIEFVPENFVEVLEHEGFTIISEWIDFWIKDLFAVDLTYPFSCEIRSLKVEEIPIASSVTQSCTGLSREFYGEDEASIKEWLTNENSEVFVAIKNNIIVGVCMMSVYDTKNGRVAWVRELAVRPDYQRQKIGKSLIIYGLQWGIKHGATRSFLATDINNLTAIDLYTKIGFEKKNERGQINMVKQL